MFGSMVSSCGFVTLLGDLVQSSVLNSRAFRMAFSSF